MAPGAGDAVNQRLAYRFAFLGTVAAIVPLVLYGIVSMRTLRVGTHDSVVAGTVNVARRTTEQLDQWFTRTTDTLVAVAAELQGTRLERWQQERVLRNYVLAFPEIRSLTLFDRGGVALVSSRLSLEGLTLPPVERIDRRGVALAPIDIDDALLPRTTMTLVAGRGTDDEIQLVAELHLEQMWRVVDRLRIGTRGFALLADENGRLLAHGDPDEKARVARGEDVRSHPVAAVALATRPVEPVTQEYIDDDGQQWLAVATTLQSLGWVLIVEQPASEAFGLADRLQRQLLAAILIALVAMIATGLYWGRSFIAPIFTLIHGTESLAEGNLETRVHLDRRDEFQRLGEAFNQMAARLGALHEQTRRQERHAMFGRIAAGLVHDLSHPIQNIGNSCRLILKMHDDTEYRDTFRRTVDREFGIVRRVLDDLKHLGRPVPLERFPLDLVRALREVVEAMQPLADAAGVTLTLEAPADVACIVDGDMFALGRVWRNIILNALQATAPGGSVVVDITTRDDGRAGRVNVCIRDTGCGIPPDRLPQIFDDFVTTKRRGLGLGLAISKKIVEQLSGTISVSSVVGSGTTFDVSLARSAGRPRPTALEHAATGLDAPGA